MNEPTLDRDALNRLLEYVPQGQAAAFAARMVASFSTDALKRIERVRAAINLSGGPDLAVVRREGHALKGGAATLCAPRAAALAYELESAAVGASPAELEAKVKTFAAELESLVVALTTAVKG